ncbi:MAG: DUF4412 domain-containing protein [Candidatus Aminicenantes bacterium]|nr:DUF4412 domain-containing protein [Candidatus Aminicenantes bacterium]
MKYRSVQLALTSIVLSVFLLPLSVNADHVVKKTKQTTETVMNGSNQKSSNDDGTTWISKNKMRQDDGGATSIIIRLDKDKVFILNHVDKTYSEMDLPVKLEENLTPESKQIIQVIKISSSVTETQETRVIKGWRSQKFSADISISMMGMDMPMTMEIWASKETGINLKTFRKFYAVLLSMNPFTKDLVEEFQKIEGYPVLTKISMRVKGVETKSHEEVITVEESRAPKGTYDLPSEYTRVAYNPLILGNGNSQR